MDKPKILTLNLTEKSNQLLIENGYDIFEGSLGKLIDTQNKKHDFKYCLTNHNFPANAHEFDIIIIDLSNEETIFYSKDENTRTENKSNDNLYMLCEYPQTILDPKGWSAKLLAEEIEELMEKESMIVVFQNENVLIDYKIVEENGDRPKTKEVTRISNYEFMPFFPFIKNKHGVITNVVPEGTEFAKLLNKYNSDFTYENIYNHPLTYIVDDRISDPNFHPLLRNTNKEIVSFVKFNESSSLYLFPKMIDNSNFLLEFIQNIAPEYQPNLFPNSGLKKWTTDIEYALPNHFKLLENKKLLFEEFEKKDKELDIQILENNSRYAFLHDIITETGDELVKAIIKFLKWLGFENVIDMDTQVVTIKEEDIQIENESGLLVIEVKGIGGTSKDSECSQISKIKYRRAKARGKFDVFGLYIVNHQRHLPALNRENPPFKSQQMLDATDDERGLLSTWQLFNLYYDIERGIITKQEAIEVFYNYGLLEFKPKNIVLLGIIQEIFSKGDIFILNLDNVKLKIGDVLFIEKNGRFEKLEIIELKSNDKAVVEVSNGEIGVKGNIKVTKMSNVWVKKIHES
ncbi:hypothetical protein [Flavobacterium sp.]|uniref:hypothetical protein n=1 Tax=Flavobacterium sp. TaxID=239 RepID=UPI003D0FE9FC